MLVLIFWSFVVALVPITLALATRFLAAVTGLLDPPVAPPLAWHAGINHRPHQYSHQHRLSRIGGWPDAR